ncbi:MAG TPA: tRNA (adenosine(37)-N6)-threonylcarbamoyltransferase complex dimerization subunit type 1 TsaB [Polyangiaceae bacterium]|nr:tRNA (adenosine(37)-N6)-threonylcarbamoyltransferase complex dimerization subunit type 1 TsaB [Polyangiaceae bacterium]
MKILVVDTATRAAIAASVDDGVVVRQASNQEQTRHAERLLPMIDDAMAGAAWGLSDLDLIVCGQGPGSFTGVRVGMATAKGLALACGAPLVGIVSLQAMAHAARQQQGPAPVVALLDAKKNEVFLAVYDACGKQIVAPSHLPRTEVASWMRSSTLAELDNPIVVGEVAHELDLPQARLLRHPDADLPCARSMAALAVEAWTRDPVDGIETLEPLYVRPPDIHLPRSRQ